MDINLGFTVVQISDAQLISLFWASTVTLSFNFAYYLFIKDRGSNAVSRERVWATVLIGTLIVIGTYADVLAAKPFAMKDCLLLALVAAHGWMAEDMVDRFMKRASKP
ncbi:hypothetical protein GCM10007938_25710 [Vibrio zhanjiangensis]|uniref:Phage holin family protein n=1 Tax=Vibrio zhanjiangensis TaxID=1046128 RepID=A0ABQ6EZW3_9VIBR|nr:hypothetical protein [Vibrio zhanjiangensis]GLT18790.1 hypothetical protein GCM10007938_25710 [Vibrio zhanjiangensis]